LHPFHFNGGTKFGQRSAAGLYGPYQGSGTPSKARRKAMQRTLQRKGWASMATGERR
jgi:hypothetical protein